MFYKFKIILTNKHTIISLTKSVLQVQNVFPTNITIYCLIYICNNNNIQVLYLKTTLCLSIVCHLYNSLFVGLGPL